MSAILQHLPPNTTIFPAWQNHLEKEPAKPVEVKKTIEKIEYKSKQKVKKEVEVKAFIVKRHVTKDFYERQKIKPFGIGVTEDDLRQNVNLTSIQRENVWHPFYEIKLEEEDFKEKYQRQQKEKKEKAMMNADIEEIENKLKSLEEKERQEQQMLLDAASGVGEKKKFDMKKIAERKREEEKLEASIPQDDPYTVKLRGLTNDMTEDDIWAAMKRFGEIIKVKIPLEELRNGKKRSKGFAFVTFKITESANRALEDAEVNVDHATLDIERALKRAPAAGTKDGSSNQQAFEMLKRRT